MLSAVAVLPFGQLGEQVSLCTNLLRRNSKSESVYVVCIGLTGGVVANAEKTAFITWEVKVTHADFLKMSLENESCRAFSIERASGLG